MEEREDRGREKTEGREGQGQRERRRQEHNKRIESFRGHILVICKSERVSKSRLKDERGCPFVDEYLCNSLIESSCWLRKLQRQRNINIDRKMGSRFEERKRNYIVLKESGFQTNIWG